MWLFILMLGLRFPAQNEGCTVKSNDFVDKILFNSDDFHGKVIPSLTELGYELSNTRLKFKNNNNYIFLLEKDDNVIHYVDGLEAAYYAELTDKNLTFYKKVRIGDTKAKFLSKTGANVQPDCDVIEIYDEEGYGKIQFFFKNDILEKVILDF